MLYPAAVFVGRVPLGRFARACAPSRVVALTSRSSLAALPATFEGARQLGLPEPIIAFFIPLSASMFRVGAAMAQTVGVLFGVDTIPDTFRTMANVTGWLGGGAILAPADRPVPAAGSDGAVAALREASDSR